MSGDRLPVDPTLLSEADDGRVDSLEGRIARLEENSASKSLSADDIYNRLLQHEIRQRIASRYFVIGLSVFVIIFMGCMANVVLATYFVGPIVFVSASLATALFVAPIVSISAVTITLLIGVFRRFHENDLERVDRQSVIESARNVYSS